MPDKNFHFHRDAILTTVFTYFIIFVLGFVFFNAKFLNPIKAALKDFQYTDVYFSTFKAKNTKVSEDIVLINIAEYQRSEIVKILPIIESFQPEVLGFDITFPDLKNEATDTIFKQFIDSTTIPLVFTSQIEYLEDKKNFPFTITSFF